MSYWQEDALKANLSGHSFNRHTYSFGAWISPELMDTLQPTIGGTGKLWNSAWTDRKTEWSIDFRLRLQVMDDLSITTMNNISSSICADFSMADRDGNRGKTVRAYKPGSTLGGFSKYSINETTLRRGKTTDYNYFAQTAYKFGFSDSLSLDARVAAISNYRFDTNNTDNGYLSWRVVLELEAKGIFAAEALAKGVRQDENNYGFVFGGYAKLLCLPILPQFALGGAVGMYGDKVEEWSTDLRLHFTLGDHIHLTTMNNFTKVLRQSGKRVSKKASTVTGLGGLTKGGVKDTKSSQMLWNIVSLSFKLNDTLTIISTIGQMTDFDSGETKDGTQIFVNSYVQIYAANNASISVSVTSGFDRQSAVTLSVQPPFHLPQPPVLSTLRCNR